MSWRWDILGTAFTLSDPLNPLSLSLSLSHQDHKLYNEYEPKKILIAYPHAKPHPDPIVETASLAGVTPPDLRYYSHHTPSHFHTF